MRLSWRNGKATAQIEATWKWYDEIDWRSDLLSKTLEDMRNHGTDPGLLFSIGSTERMHRQRTFAQICTDYSALFGATLESGLDLLFDKLFDMEYDVVIEWKETWEGTYSLPRRM